MTKLTLEQAIVVTGYTGKLACAFADFHRDVEIRLGRPVYTHEFGSREFADQLAELYKPDFLSMIL